MNRYLGDDMSDMSAVCKGVVPKQNLELSYCQQRRQSGLKAGGSWVRIAKLPGEFFSE